MTAKPIIQPSDIREGDTIRAEWTTGTYDDGQVRGGWSVNYVAKHDADAAIDGVNLSTVTYRIVKRRPIPPEVLGLPGDTLTFGLLTWITYEGSETSRWAYWHRNASGERMLAPHANYDIPTERVMGWEPNTVPPDHPEEDDTSREGESKAFPDLPRGEWEFGCMRWRNDSFEVAHYGWWRKEFGRTDMCCHGAFGGIPVARIVSWQPLEIVPRDSFIELSDMYAGTTSARTKGVRDFLNDVHGTALHHGPEEPF